MKFRDMFKKEEESQILPQKIKKLNESEKQPEDLLRSNGFKIKLITGTAFGKQIDFFKVPDEEKIKKILQDFNIKFKNKSVFIVY